MVVDRLPGVLVNTLHSCGDLRGENVVLFDQRDYGDFPFVQDNYSVSRRDVLRGIHGDRQTFKVITCLSGTIVFVVVDCRVHGGHFGEFMMLELSGENKKQVVVPPGFGNAHLVTSDQAIFHYKLSSHYDQASQFTYTWDDPRFAIPWPITHPILSDRDSVRG